MTTTETPHAPSPAGAFIIYLAGVTRSPSLKFYGERGAIYSFRWSEAYRAMIFEGCEVTAAEFDRVAADIFGATYEQNIGRPIPKRISHAGSSEGFRLPPFDEHRTVLELCGRLGRAEEERAELLRAIERARSEGLEVTIRKPQPRAAEAPAPAIQPKDEAFTDFDPDAMAPVALPKEPAKVITPKPLTPTADLAPPGFQSGDFDPDEISVNSLV